jgi:hypothetical protein
MKRTFASLLLSAMLAQPAELPVKQVVLYKHGIGFFERSGRLAPGESARLDFNATEMNDVLKSLTVEERGGGKVSGLRYDSMDPLGHRLAEFPFQVGEAQPLAAMLDQLKGARIELRFGNETLAGTVVSGRIVEGGDKQPQREQLTLLLDSGELRTVDLSAAAGIRFPDVKLQQQFRDYLAAVAAARSKDKRSVYIDSTDAKDREVMVSYTIPTAVWKSSYRLVLPTSGQPVLEGWAIVDNTTGEDWTKVQLSLVSGRPISFVSQLYPPKYLDRPGAELADDAAARPVVHEGAFQAGTGNVAGVAGALGGGVFARGRSSAPAAPAPAHMMVMSADGATVQAEVAAEKAAVAPSSIVAGAAGRELGELFEYRIGQPVTIRKSESAMLPFLQQAITGRKLLIYSDHNSQHPNNAAELTNSTGKTLDGGPITVYDGGAYGGEALMETVKSGDKRLISYAVDLGTRITEAFGGEASIMREVHASRGILTTKYAAEEKRTYTVRNIDQKAKTLIIEHPLRPNYTLLNQKPLEKTATAYRFELALAPGATQEFPVNEERIFDQSVSVVSLSPDVLVSYVRNRNLSDAGKRQLQRIADQKSQITENDRALQDVAAQIRELTSDEDRIRANIGSLNNVSGQQQQVQSYARQLDQHEQQLATLRDRQADLQKKKTALDGELNRLIEGLSF